MPISLLPAELLLRIFDLVTFVPHSLDVETADPFVQARQLGFNRLLFPINLQDDVFAVRTSLLTKSIISRVCRQWHSLVQPFLYEILSFNDEQSLVELHERIREHELLQSDGAAELETDSGLELKLQRYTKRLDITLRRPNSLNDQDFESAFSCLVKHLCRLEISIIFSNNQVLGRNRPEIPVYIVEAFHSSCLFTLRKIAWNIPPSAGMIRELEEPTEFYELIEDAPNLSTVVVVPIYCEGRVILFNPLHNSVKTRSLVSPIPIIPQWRTAEVDPAHPMFVRLTYPSRRQVYHGMSLGQSSIYVYSHIATGSRADLELVTELDIHHYIYFPSSLRLHDLIVLPDSITHLGLQVDLVMWASDLDRFVHMLQLYLRWQHQSAPNLLVVRSLCPMFFEAIQESSAAGFRELVLETESWHFRLEDDRGLSLQEWLKEQRAS